MKRVIIIGLIFCFFECFCQNNKMNFLLVNEIESNKLTSKINENEIDVLVKTDTLLNELFFSSFNVKLLHGCNYIYTLRGTLTNIKALSFNKNIKRIEKTNHNYSLLDDSALVKNVILPIHIGEFPLSNKYSGKSVIVGIIDTGIDFEHPDFKDSTGNTRIKYIWDQKISSSGIKPMPFNYGQEWDSLSIMQGKCLSVDNQHACHGTRVCGVAAGNGNSNFEYRGIAPDADLIVVALDFNNTTNSTITDAVSYIFSKADSMGKACVINCSFGDYMGSHDGKDLQTQYIDSLISAKKGRALIAAAGNAGQQAFHLGYSLAMDTAFTWIKNSTNKIFLDVYADSADFSNLNINIGINAPDYSERSSIGFRSIDSSLNKINYDTIYYNGNRLGVVLTYTDLTDGVYCFSTLIQPDSLNYLWSLFTAGTGKIDSWNFDFKNTDLPSLDKYPKIIKYKRPDTLQTICSGFQCSKNVITVGNYVGRNKHISFDNSIHTSEGIVDSIFRTSSIGPTRDLRIKPDISASGENIITTGESSFMNWVLQHAPYAATKDSMHILFGGTSAAAPIVSGLAALYFEAFPNATFKQLKEDIINCSKSDQFTGTVPNNRWGYGKLNGFGTLTCSLPNTVNYSVKQKQENQINLFPNPFRDKVTIQLKHEGQVELLISDLLGRVIVKSEFHANNTSYFNLNLPELSKGLYLFTIHCKNDKTTQLVIKE